MFVPVNTFAAANLSDLNSSPVWSFNSISFSRAALILFRSFSISKSLEILKVFSTFIRPLFSSLNNLFNSNTFLGSKFSGKVVKSTLAEAVYNSAGTCCKNLLAVAASDFFKILS